MFFCFSVFYVFYEQYLSIWEDTILSLLLSFAAIFVVTLILTGLSWFASTIVLIFVCLIIINVAGCMYWWNISLNAVSLVNLVMVSFSMRLKTICLYVYILVCRYCSGVCK